MRVSVVICTFNRADSLAATLECLRHQSYDDFEVIVVNGPSTDHTLDVLEPWRARIKYSQNEHRNLSISRNLGIRATAGEIVAFIDDDALPEADWMRQAVAAFDDPEVAGTGGIVFDHTGLDLQWSFTAIDRFGTVHASKDEPFDDQCFPGSFQFPYLQGTNALFRRDRLYDVDGFDETYEFYLDETDVCCRLIDAGWKLKQLPDAAVHHKYLPSAIRDHQRITRNWYPVIKNHTYFCFRHASAMFTEEEIVSHMLGAIESRLRDTQFHVDGGRLGPDAIEEARATCLTAFADGLRIGRDGVGRALPTLPDDHTEYLPFDKIDTSAGRKLTLVSSGYTGNITGGIARMFSDLAPGLAARGHDVRVITRATDHAAVDFEDGVWVHRIEVGDPGGQGVAPEAPPPVNAFATAVVDEVRRIEQWSSHDVVFGPAFDVEVLGVLRQTNLPVAVHVATPVAVAADMAGLMTDATHRAELERLIALEGEVIRTADLDQVNTHAALATIRDLYGESGGPERWRIAGLGLEDRRTPRVSTSSRRRVLFVGRFEARKGIDVVLGAMERILDAVDDVELVLIGEDRPLEPGQPLFGASWLGAHRDAPWADRVIAVGPAGDDELHQAYADADLVVLPSRYESFGLVMAEAMMHGKPLVSTRAGGIPEVVRDGVDGLLVPPGDVAATAAAIQRLLDDTHLAAELGASARRRFVDVFSIDPYVARFDALLRSVGTAPDEITAVARGTILSAGRTASWELPPGRAATVHLRPRGRSRVLVGGAGCAPIQLEGDRVHRVRLATSPWLEVLEGEVRYEGATVAVAAEA